MAVPRLTQEKCFIELDPARISDYRLPAASRALHSWAGWCTLEMQPIDLIVCGSVAVNREGARLGKGGGFSDLEYAVALTLGLISVAHAPR